MKTIKGLMLLLIALVAMSLSGCSAVGGATGGSSSILLIVYVVFFVGLIYFMSIRPQKKEKKAREAMMSTLAIGDTILTTSGFYGVVIDMTDDMVIVEFGNNKNCRIPMQKGAIVQVEKPEAAKKEEKPKEEK